MLGPGHERMQVIVTGLFTVGAPVGCSLLGIPIESAVVVCLAAPVGGALSVIFTPDLIDIDGDTLPEGRIRSIGFLGDALASAYDVISWVIPHRGISHTPVAGTLITLIPLSLAWVPLVIFGGHFARQLFLATVVFKCVADLAHIIIDPIWTKLKKWGIRE